MSALWGGECPECSGYGSTATALPGGGRLVACCPVCRGSGLAEPVERRYPIYLRDEETCDSKRSYATRGRAMRAISELRKIGFKIDHPYKCRVCGRFHLTTSRQKKEGCVK